MTASKARLRPWRIGLMAIPFVLLSSLAGVFIALTASPRKPWPHALAIEKLRTEHARFERVQMTLNHMVAAKEVPDRDVPGKVPPGDSKSVERENWDRFPRTNYDFVRTARDFPATLNARNLFRHVALNPGDVYISTGQRSAIESLMRAYREKLDALQAILESSRAKELALLHSVGAALNLRRTPTGQYLMPLDRDGGEPFCFTLDTNKLGKPVAFGAPISQLPFTYKAFIPYRFLGQEMAGHLLNKFVQIGVLPQSEAASLARALFSPSQRTKKEER